MDTIKSVPTRVKGFVIRHKVGVAIVSTAVICLKLNRVSLREHDEFLASKGLLDEFYSPEE